MARKRILAVDDESDVLLILKTALAEEFDVLTATNGMDALAIASEERPDLIILDIMMPEMDGMEVLGELKAMEETAEIPVVFLTGLSDKEKIREALGKGTAYYIVKPFDCQDLINKVKLAMAAV